MLYKVKQCQEDYCLGHGIGTAIGKHMEIGKRCSHTLSFVTANTVHTNTTDKHTDFICCVGVDCITSDCLTVE